MIEYIVILTMCLVLGQSTKVRVLSLSLLFCLITGALVARGTDSIQLITLSTHFSVIFISFLLLTLYSKDKYIVMVYGATLFLTLLSYTCWQYPMLLGSPVSLLIIKYGITIGIELGLLLLLAKESYKSFRGCLLITSITFIYLHGYL